jgi:hypothetical protein
MRTPSDDKDAAFEKSDSWSTVSHLEATSRQPLHAGMNQSLPVGYTQTTPIKSNAATAAPAAAHSFEIEPAISSTITSKESWLQRLPWRRSDQDRNSDTLDFAKPGEAIYQGGQMGADPRPGLGFTVGQEEMPAPEQPKRRARGYAVGFSPRSDEVATSSPYSFQAVASWLSRSSSKRTLSVDEDSLADFEDSEWTQPDSSYGAAIPFGGWIPKNIRRTIESTLIAILFIGLVYLVVATSIRVTEETSRHSNTTGNGTDYGGLNLDDDRYIAYGNDDASSIYGYNSNDDAYSNGDDTYSNQNDDGSGSGSGSGYGNNNNNQGNGYSNNYNNGDDANNNDDDAYGGRRLLPSLDIIDELLA